MRSTQRFSITLPNDMAEAVRAKVASGELATESEVIREGLRILIARDHAVDAWLRTEVAAAYDALKSSPKRGVSTAKVREHLSAVYRRFATNA
ncbi:MAG TPA: type II toxin-antitoxin system ParD family antitoxin [Burkholderiaceae bacterium]|nr:type II toxin-antitoxin system ParD family antitoxin [Burkholderiaceae bacterium]